MILVSVLTSLLLHASAASTGTGDSTVLNVKKVDDFTITGDGHARQWEDIAWVPLPQRTSGTTTYESKFRIAYSAKGIYILFAFADKKLTSSLPTDGLRLWTEDVAELFLWPDQSTPDYLEYEISPLNHELVLLVSNHPGRTVRWQPFPYEETEKTSHMVSVAGKQEASAPVTGWTAEIFLPFSMMEPLHNCPPAPGTKWRANFYRVDYDTSAEEWAWRPVTETFHDYKHFGTLVFR